MGPLLLECIAAGGDRAVLRIDGDIEACTAPQLRERVRDLAGHGTVHLIADLRGAGFLDSAGLGALVRGVYGYHAGLAGRPGRRSLRPERPGPARILHRRAAAPAPGRNRPAGPVPGPDRGRPPRRGGRDRAGGRHLGRIVPSSYWRAREVIRAVADRGVPEAAELAEAYREACGNNERPALP
jgi:hypothetical protein